MKELLERISDAVRLVRMGRITAALAALRARAAEAARAAGDGTAAFAPHAAAAQSAGAQTVAAQAAAHSAGTHSGAALAAAETRSGLQPAPPPRPRRAPVPRPAAPPRPRRRPGLGEVVRALAERSRRALAPELPAPEIAPAPTPPSPGARFEARRYADAWGARDYKLFIPGSAAGSRRPLVVMLHGCSQNPDDFARGTGMNAAAEQAGVLVLYPAQTSAANPRLCWNWFSPEDQGGEAALLASLTREVAAAEAVDLARVFVAGLSAGGAQAMNLAARFPQIFAAVGVHSGLPAGAARDMLSAFSAMLRGGSGAAADRPLRTIVFHGDADRVVHPANAEAVAAQATAAAGPLELRLEAGETGGRAYSRALRRDRRGAVVCETWTIHGAGHAWSGGDPAGSFADPSGPDASREMLRFFLETRE